MTLELRVVLRHLAMLMLVISALIAAVAIFAWIDYLTGEPTETVEPVGMLIAALAGTLIGIVLLLPSRRSGPLLAQREALLLVALSWLVGAVLSALPYWLWAMLRSSPDALPHCFDSFVNCYFEAMSGLTTTGATIIPALDTVPRSLLLWRALTHWIGGLGIVVLFVAVLPMLGVGTRRIYWHEAPGVSREGVRPRIQDTARVLWIIYSGLTVAEVIALKLAGMSWFDAVCHTFATLATGGFSTQDASIAAYQATGVQVIIIVFMVLAGVNFSLYYHLLQRRWREVVSDAELRAYLAIITAATVVITVCLLRDPAPAPAAPAAGAFGPTLLHSAFQAISIQTTTGFCSANFDAWGFVPKATLLVLMFIGASAGSTGGGIKVVRILILAKVLFAELEHYYRPKVVRSVRIGKAVIDPALRLNTLVYVLGIAVLFAVGTVLLMIFEQRPSLDITTAATASAATLNNIGPGLARVGASQNYAWFSAPSKITMCVLMVLGRLEMFTILVLFTPRFWKAE